MARWITETEAERARYQAAKRATPLRTAPSMSRDEIASVVTALSDLLTVLRQADPADKAEIYTQLGLRLVHQPSDQTVRAEVHTTLRSIGNSRVSEERVEPNAYAPALSAEFPVGNRS